MSRYVVDAEYATKAANPTPPMSIVCAFPLNGVVDLLRYSIVSPRKPYETVAAIAMSTPPVGTLAPDRVAASDTYFALTANPAITTPIALNCAVVNLRFKNTADKRALNGINNPESV